MTDTLVKFNRCDCESDRRAGDKRIVDRHWFGWSIDERGIRGFGRAVAVPKNVIVIIGSGQSRATDRRQTTEKSKDT